MSTHLKDFPLVIQKKEEIIPSQHNSGHELGFQEEILYSEQKPICTFLTPHHVMAHILRSESWSTQQWELC